MALEESCFNLSKLTSGAVRALTLANSVRASSYTSLARFNASAESRVAVSNVFFDCSISSRMFERNSLLEVERVVVTAEGTHTNCECFLT